MKGVYRFMALLLAVVLASAFWLPTAVRAQVGPQANLLDRVNALEAEVDALQIDLTAAQTTIATLQIDLNNEIVARLAGDFSLGDLQTDLSNEIVARLAGDFSLQSNIDAIVIPVIPANLLELASFVSVETVVDVNGLVPPHIFIEGANVHIQDGSGTTAAASPNGLGNLIVGYNEGRIPPTPPDVSDRGGSHNIIVGQGHKYTSFGGFVTGSGNTVSGGFSSVIGGQLNTASGSVSSVSGGSRNMASGDVSSVTGGFLNTASGPSSSVSGGGSNEASGPFSSVRGGFKNTASGNSSSVSGGAQNTASGFQSSVSGGKGRTAPDTHDWAAGSLFEDF